LAERAVATLVEHAEAQAYVDLFRAAPDHLGIHAYEFDAATVLVAPGVDIPLFNRALGLGIDAPASEAAIESIVSIYHESKVRNFAVQISPVALTPGLLGWLTAERLAVRDRWSKMFRSGEARIVPHSDLRIAPAGIEQSAAFGRVACQGFGMPIALAPWLEASVGRPGWHHYLAWDGDQPVATGALYVQDRVGWLGVATTLTTHRRRGAQLALMAARLRAGVELGCEWFVTETGEDSVERPNSSYHNMVRAGFSLAYQRPNYMRAQSSPAPQSS
jgi:hypothetical protein